MSRGTATSSVKSLKKSFLKFIILVSGFWIIGTITLSGQVPCNPPSVTGSLTPMIIEGCSIKEVPSAATSEIVITDPPALPDPVIVKNDNEIESFADYGNQWYNSSGIIPGATGKIKKINHFSPLNSLSNNKIKQLLI